MKNTKIIGPGLDGQWEMEIGTYSNWKKPLKFPSLIDALEHLAKDDEGCVDIELKATCGGLMPHISEPLEWVDGLPTQSGHYWFYGHIDMSQTKESDWPVLRHLYAPKTPSGITYVLDGNFCDLTRSNAKHCKMVMPNLSKVRF